MTYIDFLNKIKTHTAIDKKTFEPLRIAEFSNIENIFFLNNQHIHLLKAILYDESIHVEVEAVYHTINRNELIEKYDESLFYYIDCKEEYNNCWASYNPLLLSRLISSGYLFDQKELWKFSPDYLLLIKKNKVQFIPKFSQSLSQYNEIFISNNEIVFRNNQNIFIEAYHESLNYVEVLLFNQETKERKLVKVYSIEELESIYKFLNTKIINKNNHIKSYKSFLKYIE